MLSYVTRYYIVRFLYAFSLSFTKTTFYLYLRTNHHLSHEDILLVFAIFNISVMILELPTSAIGEIIGPRICFLSGMFLKIIAALCFFYGSDFWHFCGAEIISALALSLISGTLNTWIMNQISIKNEKSSQTVSHIFMIGRRLGTLALAIGGVLGAIVGAKDLRMPWLFVAIGATITFSIAFLLITNFISSPVIDKSKNDLPWGKVHRRWQWRTIIEGYRLALSNKILLVIIWDSFLLSFALASPRITWIPLLKSEFNKDMWFIANIWLCIAAIQFLGTFWLDYFLQKIQSVVSLKFIFFLQGFLFLACLCIPNLYIFIIFYLLLEWVSPYQQTLTFTLIQQETTSQGRLTILSLENLAGKFGDAIGLMVASSLSAHYSLSIVWTIGVILYSTIVPCYIVLLQKENSQKIIIAETA